jgi:uncharacterized protein YggE
MQTITLELTLQEAHALGQLLDLAVKAGGLSVAEPALVIARKVGDASRNADTAAATSPPRQT